MALARLCTALLRSAPLCCAVLCCSPSHAGACPAVPCALPCSALVWRGMQVPALHCTVLPWCGVACRACVSCVPRSLPWCSAHLPPTPPTHQLTNTLCWTIKPPLHPVTPVGWTIQSPLLAGPSSLPVAVLEADTVSSPEPAPPPCPSPRTPTASTVGDIASPSTSLGQALSSASLRELRKVRGSVSWAHPPAHPHLPVDPLTCT